MALAPSLVAAPDTKSAAARVDKLIEAGYDRNKIEPNPGIDDALSLIHI